MTFHETDHIAPHKLSLVATVMSTLNPSKFKTTSLSTAYLKIRLAFDYANIIKFEINIQSCKQ